MEEDKKSYKGIRHQVLKRTPPAGGGERDTDRDTSLVLGSVSTFAFVKKERKKRKKFV